MNDPRLPSHVFRASHLSLEWSQVQPPQVKPCGQGLDKTPPQMRSLKSTAWTETSHYLNLLNRAPSTLGTFFFLINSPI